MRNDHIEEFADLEAACLPPNLIEEITSLAFFKRTLSGDCPVPCAVLEHRASPFLTQ
jgi:hypothetical protein